MSKRCPLFVLVTVMVLGTIAAAPEAARESATVDGYELTVGGADDPIITGERMWLELETVDEETGEPVEGQADTLEVSMQQSGGEKVAWESSEKHGEPGVYESAVIFTEPGEYFIPAEGSVEDTEIHTHFEKDGYDHTELEYPSNEPADDDMLTDILDPDSVTGIGIAAFTAIVIAVIGALLLRR